MAEKGWISKFALQDKALANDSVGRGAMEDGFLSADTEGRAKVADSFVNTAKLLDGAVTLEKLFSTKILYTGVYGYSQYGSCVYG